MPELTITEGLQLAQQWLRAGRTADVEQLCQRILSMGPNTDALQLLSSALLKLDRRPEAAETIRSLIRLTPQSAEAWHNLGLVLTPIDRDGAIAAYQSAIAIRPDFFEARYNLAICWFDAQRLADAEWLLRDLIDLRPDLPEMHHALGNVLRAKNQPLEALAEYQKALAIRPDWAEARWHASLAMLTLGDFKNGWPAYESRRQLQGIWREPTFSQPAWRGEDLKGRRILLWTEQGFGDAIQFIRYAPLIAQRGGRVSVLCQPELRRLFQSCDAIDRLFTTPDEARDFDLQAPLMSLPAIFQTTLESIPAVAPYLAADNELASAWSARMPGIRRVGIAWASGAGAGRSIPASEFDPLAAMTDITFYNLQKSGGGARPNVPMLDFSTDLNDFADTAALVQHLDLVITCDTAVAHLAGALGKPAWVILPYAAPWRWMLDRADSPWYPTVRLFRQRAPGDWRSAVTSVISFLHT